jgi:hypothetical protein
MSVTKDLVKEYWVTTDTPEIYGGSNPTWVQFKGTSLPERIGDSDEPEEEPTTQSLGDGREAHASVGQNFTQTIFEDDEDSSVFDEFDGASLGNNQVWLKRVPAQANKETEIIGGQMGMMVAMGKVRMNDEGHRAFNVQYSAVGVGAGDTIEVDTSGS